MDADFQKSVSKAVREVAESVSVDELQARGIAQVKSVKMSHICELVERAIQRVLVARSVKGVSEDDGDLSTETREEFVKLVKSKGEDGGDRMLDEASTELSRLNEELDRQQDDLDQQSRDVEDAQGASMVEDAVLEKELRGHFQRFTTEEAPIDELADHVVAASVETLRRERLRAERAELAARESATGLLERRIEKLKRLLRDTESKIVAPDSGLRSGRRSEEGLDESDELFAKKSAMLEGVFRDNVRERQEPNG